ncbi:MAG: hypothetical protein ACLGHN_10160 [Bacteriovoracia bacterium]
MKYLLALLFIFPLTVLALSNEQSISGKVASVKGCSDKVMVWLSLDKDNYKERLLLMHTEVPVGGSFKFYVRAGSYQVRASDKEGCEFFQRVGLKKEDTFVNVRMVKK